MKFIVFNFTQPRVNTNTRRVQ